MLIQYFRDRKNRPVVTLVADKMANGKVQIGWSKCCVSSDSHATDTFSKEKGKNIAIQRMKHGSGVKISQVPNLIRENLPGFINRCQRYFKTEDVVFMISRGGVRFNKGVFYSAVMT